MKSVTQYFYFLLSIVLLFSACSGTDRGTNAASDSAFVSWEGFSMAQANDQDLSNERKTKYRLDAERLAVRFINSRDSTQTEIPSALETLFYNGVIHIVNATHPEAEEATNPDYDVHALTPPDPRGFEVSVDTTASWIDAWRESTTQTGNEEVDNLLEQFDLSLFEYRELENSSIARAFLRSEYAINVYAVARLFEEIKDVEASGTEVIGGGSDITVLFFDDHLRYTLEYGYGDCPSGCNNRHKWNFRVFEDGSVEFIGEQGDPLP